MLGTLPADPAQHQPPRRLAPEEIGAPPRPGPGAGMLRRSLVCCGIVRSPADPGLEGRRLAWTARREGRMRAHIVLGVAGSRSAGNERLPGPGKHTPQSLRAPGGPNRDEAKGGIRWGRVPLYMAERFWPYSRRHSSLTDPQQHRLTKVLTQPPGLVVKMLLCSLPTLLHFCPSRPTMADFISPCDLTPDLHLDDLKPACERCFPTGSPLAPLSGIRVAWRQ